MDQGPLVREQIDTGSKFLGEFAKFLPIDAAFWMKVSDEGTWYLHVASDRIDSHSISDAYDEVIRLASVLQDPEFDPFQVKLLSSADPVAQAAIDTVRRYPSLLPLRLRGQMFGGEFIDQVYLYPAATAAVTS